MAAAALLLTAPQALASRTASTRPELLASLALEQAPAVAQALAPAYAPRGFELHVTADSHPRQLALFPDLMPVPASIAGEKPASGVASWAPRPNLQRIQVFVAESWQVREKLGPVDSPNLYQAFGLDPQNNTDPLGLCGWWSDTLCREELAQAAEKVKGAVAGWFERNKQRAERIVEHHKQVAQKSGAELKRVYGALGQAVHDQIAHDATLVGSLPSATYLYFHSKHDMPEWKDANRTIGETVITGLTYYVAWEVSKGQKGQPQSGAPKSVGGYGITAETSPYVVRYDPRFPGRPDSLWSVDTAGFSGTPTASGGVRNAPQFWKRWLEQRPETISPLNKYLIDQLQINPRGPSPRIDATWVEHFPEHTRYLQMESKLRTLVHHHVDQGRFAIPVPKPSHVGSGGPWHGFPLE